MKIFKRQVSLAVVGLFVAQLFFSCSTTQTQWGKNDISKNNLEIAQNTVANEQTLVLNVNPQQNAVVNTANKEIIAANKQIILAYSAKELPVVAQKTNAAKTMFSKGENAPVKVKKQTVRTALKNLNNITGVADTKDGGKSQLIALILAVALGYLGIHRFYLGYYWQGVVQLLTAGGCGIWALIDIIRIITGSLQPKDGSYDKTFDDL